MMFCSLIRLCIFHALICVHLCVVGFFCAFKDFSKAMSRAGTSQFQEVIRQELEYSMKEELDKILATAPSNELEVRAVVRM